MIFVNCLLFNHSRDNVMGTGFAGHSGDSRTELSTGFVDNFETALGNSNLVHFLCFQPNLDG